MPPRHEARGPRAGRGAGARAARFPSPGPAVSRPRRGDCPRTCGRGEQQRHARPPRADLAPLDATRGVALCCDAAHDAAHVAGGARRGGSFRGPHHCGEPRGRPRAAPPLPSRRAASRRDERYRRRAGRRSLQRGRSRRRSRGVGRSGRPAGGAGPRAPQGSARPVEGAGRTRAASGGRVRRDRERCRPPRGRAHRSDAPPRRVRALHRPAACVRSPRRGIGSPVPYRRAVHRAARDDGARIAGRCVGCRREPRPDHLRRHRSARAAARPGRVGAGPRARPGRWGVRRADRAAGSGTRPAGVHARAHRRADRGGVLGSPRAAAIARRPSRAGAVTTTLLLALNFPPFGGGIARMMGEVALRYQPQGLTISTGTWPGCEASDARFTQTIDRVAVGAKRLRTLNGLCLWSWRAASLVRRTQPGFAWCDEIKPAGYAAAWLHARRGLPFGVVAHGADLLLLQAKIRRSAFKRWTARRMLERCSVVVANSRWTADLARSVLEFLGCRALAADVRTVPLGTMPSRFRSGLDAGPVRRKYGLDGGPWLLTVARLDFHK